MRQPHGHKVAKPKDQRVFRKKREIITETSVLKGKGSAELAFLQLSNFSASHKITAGHIAIELAKKHRQTDAADKWLSNAFETFQKASQESILATHAAQLLLCRAEIGMVQSHSLQSLLVHGRLPTATAAETTRSLYLQQAHNLVEARQSMIEAGDYVNAQDALGLLGELSVLALCHRFAVKEVGPDTWFPYQATFFEDNANAKAASTLNQAWDISIFTDLGEGPDIAYKLQVKSTDTTFSNYRPDAPGISRVCIAPDLRSDIDRGASDTIAHILTECAIEADSNNRSHHAASRLDYRMDRLLEIIDSTQLSG